MDGFIINDFDLDIQFLSFLNFSSLYLRSHFGTTDENYLVAKSGTVQCIISLVTLMPLCMISGI